MKISINRSNLLSRISLVFEELFIVFALLVLVVIFSLTTDNFFTTRTLTAILTQLPGLTIVTIGMTLVLISGGIDLSVGSIVALSSAVIGVALTVFELTLPVAALMGIAAGGCAGLVNGVLGSFFRLPIFIVTLGMLEAGRGLAYLVTESQTKDCVQQLRTTSASQAGKTEYFTAATNK